MQMRNFDGKTLRVQRINCLDGQSIVGVRKGLLEWTSNCGNRRRQGGNK